MCQSLPTIIRIHSLIPRSNALDQTTRTVSYTDQKITNNTYHNSTSLQTPSYRKMICPFHRSNRSSELATNFEPLHRRLPAHHLSLLIHASK